MALPLTPEEDPAQKKELPIWPFEIQSGKCVAMLQKHAAGLRSDPSHGNQQLFLDDVFIAYLLAFYNPSIRSLRTIEDFSQTQQAQEFLSITKICKSTLSDFNKLVDPTQLEPILAAIKAELSKRSVDGRIHASDLNSLVQHGQEKGTGTFRHSVLSTDRPMLCQFAFPGRPKDRKLDFTCTCPFFYVLSGNSSATTS